MRGCDTGRGLGRGQSRRDLLGARETPGAHDRITGLHLKDRRINGGPNVPWGQGDTPIKEVLQLLAEGRLLQRPSSSH